MAGSIFVPLISVFDAKGIRDAKTGLASIAGVVKNLKGAAIAAGAAMATVGSINFVKDAVTAARDLDRNMVGLGNVFGDLTPDMQKFAKDAQAIGLSQVEAARASTFLGSVLKQSGFEMTVVAGETKNLVGLASDLAATYGYDVSEALTGMTALFRGEYDPIEKFGVAMKQAEVNALLAARGQKNLTGATLRQAQAQARLDILYQRSQDAQGAYAQQSGTLFTEQKNLAAAFNNLKASLGASLTTPFANLLSAMMPIVDALGKALAPAFEMLADLVQKLTPIIQPLVDVLMVVWDALFPIFDILMKLIQPLLVPLASVFKLLTSVLTPLVPLIQFLANVLAAILAPAIFVVTMALRLVIEGFTYLVDFLGGIPGVGDVFKNINKGLKEFVSRVGDASGSTDGMTASVSAMTAKLSKKLPVKNIDDLGKSAGKTAKSVQNTTDKLSAFIKDAVNLQKSIIDSANISELMEDSSSEIVQSITYLDGKFKVVAVSASQGASDIATNFKNRLNQIKAFYENLTKLSKANLDSSLIQQIVSAGPEAGNATAEAILASGEEGIKGLNKTAKDIKKVAGDIGVLGASAMKKSGGKLGNGLIDGLYAQESKMIAAAKDLGAKVGDALGTSASEKLETVIAEAGAAGFKLTEAEKKKIDPNYDSNKEKTSAVAPKVNNALPRFVSSFKAGVGSGYQLMESEAIANPFSNATDAGAKAFYEFGQNQKRANEYNISIHVAPGASGAQVGDALVKAIQEYERSKGKGWRSN